MHLRNRLDDQRHQHQPDDLDHLGDLGHRHQPDGQHHLGVERLGAPFPEQMRTGCCPDEKLDEEYPCPALQRMGCFLDEGFLELPELEQPEPLHLELLNQVLLNPGPMVRQRPELQVQEPISQPVHRLLLEQPDPLGLQPLVQLERPEPVLQGLKLLPQVHRHLPQPF